MRGMFTVDWRDAWRSLRAAPMVTAFAVVSLALGIGGVTALFSILNSLALKPLPVRDPAALAILADDSWTNPIWEAVSDAGSRPSRPTRSAGRRSGSTCPRPPRPTWSTGLYASGGMFDMLGVPAVLGRTFTESRRRAGRRPGRSRGGDQLRHVAAPLRRRAGRRSARPLSIERVPFTIIGVTPKGFFGPDVGRSFDVAVPLGTEPLVRPEDSALDERLHWWMNIMVRLKPGQTAEQATALVRAIQPQIRAGHAAAGPRGGRTRRLSGRSLQARAGARRPIAVALPLRTAADGDPRRRRPRPPDRLRQRRQPAHRAGLDAPARADAAAGARRLALAASRASCWSRACGSRPPAPRSACCWRGGAAGCSSRNCRRSRRRSISISRSTGACSASRWRSASSRRCCSAWRRRCRSAGSRPTRC